MPRTTRSRWPSTNCSGCSWPACAPPAARSTRSTPWRWPATGTGTRSRAGNQTRATPRSWPTCSPTDMHAHRPLPADSELAQAIAVLARAQQNAGRGPHHRPRRPPLLRPARVLTGRVAAFACTATAIPAARSACAILVGGAVPGHAARLTLAHRGALMRKPGRKPAASTPRPSGCAGCSPAKSRCASSRSSSRPWHGRALALLRQLEAACASASDLEQAAVESFNQHPYVGIITSFPGIGALTGARRARRDRIRNWSRFKDAIGSSPTPALPPSPGPAGSPGP